MIPRRQRDCTPMRWIALFREDDEDVVLVTNLLDAEQYPATDLLDAYLSRWGIERVFQQVTEVFHLPRLIGSSPERTVFLFAFCTLLSNMIPVVRACIFGAQRMSPEKMSTDLLFNDVHCELISLSTLADRETVIDYCQPVAHATELKTRLESLFADVCENHWIKSPKKNVPKSSNKKNTIAGGHTSIFRIIGDAKSPTKDV